MIEVVVGIILVVLGPIVDSYIYGLFQIFLFPLVSLLLIRSYNFKVAVVVITIVSLALDSMLHLNLGSFLISFTGLILFDFLLGLILPKDDAVLRFLNNFLNFLIFNLLLVIFKAISFGEILSTELSYSTASLIIVSSIIMSLIYLVVENSAKGLQGRDKGHMIRIK